MYAILCNYASANDHCWPSQTTLATRLACSVSSVKKYLGELIHERLISVRHEQYRSCVYYMLRPEKMTQNTPLTAYPPMPCPQLNLTSDQAISDGTQANIGYLNNLNKQEEINTPPIPPEGKHIPIRTTHTDDTPREDGGDFCPDFEKAWELYPKKEAKGLAYAAWQYLKHHGQLPFLADIDFSIQHFMTTESWQRDEGRFVPQMSNWLRGQRWLDASVVTARQEALENQQNVRIAQAMLQKEEVENAQQHSLLQTLRPAFESFAGCFPESNASSPMVFGLWAHLHTKHRAPTASDVPKDTRMSIVEFLRYFQQQCREAEYKKRPIQGKILSKINARSAHFAHSIVTHLQQCAEVPIHAAHFALAKAM